MGKFAAGISLMLTLGSLILQLSGNNSSSYQANAFTLKDLSPQDKYWILDNYIDSITTHKSIAKYSDDPLVWEAIVLRIEEDSFYTSGTLNSSQTLKSSLNLLGTLEANGQFRFFYNQLSKRIVASDVSAGRMSKLYEYSPLTEAEYQKLVNPENAHPLQQGINKMLTERLLAGKYQSLEGKSLNMTLDSNGLVNGFQRFNKFTLHDYFGTSHPFQGLDVIWLESDRQKDRYYSWKFSADTLILTEMKTKDQETYFPAGRSFKFLKIEDF